MFKVVFLALLAGVQNMREIMPVQAQVAQRADNSYRMAVQLFEKLMF